MAADERQPLLTHRVDEAVLDNTSSCLTTTRCAKQSLAKPYALFASALCGRPPCSPSPPIQKSQSPLHYTLPLTILTLTARYETR